MSAIVNMLKSIVRWAVLNSISSDDKDFPLHKTTYMGKAGDAAAWYPYGYHANPGKDTLALMFAMNADCENRVVMPGSPKERIDPLMPTPLAEGEVVMYHPTSKSYVHFKEDGTIDIDSQLDVNVRTVGDLNAIVAGDMTADVEGNVDADIEGTTTVNSAGAIDIDTAAAIAIDAVGDIDITSSGGDVNIDANTDVSLTVGGNLRTLCDSTRFQNAAGTKDLGLTLRTWFDYMANSSFHTAAMRQECADVVTDIDALR